MVWRPPRGPRPRERLSPYRQPLPKLGTDYDVSLLYTAPDAAPKRQQSCSSPHQIRYALGGTRQIDSQRDYFHAGLLPDSPSGSERGRSRLLVIKKSRLIG